MKQLIIIRHGNTFNASETPTRVGARTDIPLVDSGREQARNIADYLLQKDLIPEKIYTSNLKRTIEMAQIICDGLGQRIETESLSIFNEIDYGPDENKTEDVVIARIGTQAIKDWDEKAMVPSGWVVNPQAIIDSWQKFAHDFLKSSHKRILVVTSNGIARFAPYVTNNFEKFTRNYNIKIATGALCRLDFNDAQKQWQVVDWNLRPPK